MAFADDVAELLDVAYGEFGVSVTWTPAAGQPRGLVGVLTTAQAIETFHEGPRRPGARRVLKLRVSEVAAVASGASLAKGDRFAAGGEDLQLINPPRREDPRQLEWTLDLG